MKRSLWAQSPPKPEGASWAEPLTVITDVKYRADGAGYLKPGYSHAFVVSADGGFPRQLTFGAFNEEGPVSWTPDGRYLLLSGNRNEGWQRDPVNSRGLSGLGRGCRDHCAHASRRPRPGAESVARRPEDRLSGLRRPAARLSERACVRHGP